MVLYENDFFKLKQAEDCFIPGYLILAPQYDEESSLALLPQGALQGLGTTCAIAHQALESILAPERIYTLAFCELVPSFHFNIFPRTTEMTRVYLNEYPNEKKLINGALFFNWAKLKYKSEKHGQYDFLVEKMKIHFQKLS